MSVNPKQVYFSGAPDWLRVRVRGSMIVQGIKTAKMAEKKESKTLAISVVLHGNQVFRQKERETHQTAITFKCDQIVASDLISQSEVRIHATYDSLLFCAWDRLSTSLFINAARQVGPQFMLLV